MNMRMGEDDDTFLHEHVLASTADNKYDVHYDDQDRETIRSAFQDWRKFIYLNHKNPNIFTSIFILVTATTRAAGAWTDRT